MNSPLTTSQLALRLRLPRLWLRDEALSGRLPCLRVGRRLLFDLEAVQRALSERAATSWMNGLHDRNLDAPAE